MKHIYITLLAMVCGVSAWGAPQEPDSLQIITSPTPHFECGESDISPLLPGLRRIGMQADSLVADSKLKRVKVLARTSADGPEELNESLARQRAVTISSWLTTHTRVPADMISTMTHTSDWQDVDTLIREAGLMSPYRASVLQTIGRGGPHDEVQSALESINDGLAWRWLADDVLPLQRSAVIDLVADKVYRTTLRPEAEPETVVEEPVEETVETVEETLYAEEEPEWVRHLYLKTNIPAWAMLWSNIAVEIDLAPHWSFTLPVYYSGLNYFTGHTKFRTLTFQPEVRWWPKKDNTGFFAGAHFGLGWYNVAFGGDYRYQDHLKHTPAIGGGVAAGYRFYFCRNHRWQMEASLGFGIYKLDYDLFQNHVNGLLVGRRQRTFYGIDQATFTISYRFDLGKKKGGER